MKRNLLYLAGFLCAAHLLAGCSEDDTSYTELVPSTQELTINYDTAPEGVVQIMSGNGNYKVVSSNEEVATATTEGNTIKVTALKAGNADLTVTDWAKMSTTIKVVVDQLQDLVLETAGTKLYLGQSKTVKVYSGNKGYKVTVDKESIVKATINDAGQINLQSLTPGVAIVTVTDKLNKTTNLTVKSVKKLLLDGIKDIPYVTIGEPFTVKVLDGNGGYSCKANGSASYLSCQMAESGLEVIIEGKTRARYNNSITISDQAGESITVPISYIDLPYLEAPSHRTLLKGSSTLAYQSMSTAKAGTMAYSADFNMSLFVTKSGTTSSASGHAIQFTGNTEVGEKENAIIYKVAKNEVDKSKEYPVADCRIDKVEDGWYWISFTEPGFAIRSYIITKQE